MKKIREIYKPYMTRPIIYSCWTKFACTLALCLLWDRFVNVKKIYSVTESAFFVAGVYLLVWAWMEYLSLDGMNHSLDSFKHIIGAFIPQKKKPMRHAQSDMVDFVDEKVTTFDMLEDDEQLLAKCCSNLITGLVFLGISLIAVLF